MRFDGNIIITDPCYIINENNAVRIERPNILDYVSKMKVDENGKYKFPEPTDYPDARAMTYEDYVIDTGYEPLAKTLYEKNKERGIIKFWSDTLYEERKRYSDDALNAVANSYDDWDKCDYGNDMDALGFTNYLSSSTLYGDWSCTVFNTDTNEKIGEFCADAGMVAVFLLDDVLKYNPDFDYHIYKPWTTTLIKDFHGEVDIVMNENEEIIVVGKGNVNFESVQTGY